MKYVPRYLLPRSTAAPAEDKGGAGNVGFVPFKGAGARARAAPRGKAQRGHGSLNKFKGGSTNPNRGSGRKKSDPLKKFGSG